MATTGQRKRSGGGSKRGSSGGNRAIVDLAAGLRGISEIAGNQALISVLARQKGQLPKPKGTEEDEDVFDVEGQEEMLAKLRLLIDKELPEEDDPKKLLAALKEHVLLLMAVLHGALEQAEGYDDDMLELFDRLKQSDDEPGEHRTEAMLELLELVKKHANEIHESLAEQLPPKNMDHGERPKVALHVLNKLKDDVRDVQDRIDSDKPSKKKAELEEGGAGAGALALLGGSARKKKKQQP
jgi:hypothetical protein